MRGTIILLAIAASMPIAAASAADLPLKAPPVPYPAAYSWTGLYGGGEFGYGWATSQNTIVTNDPGAAFLPGTVLNPIDYRGPLGGFYAGYNYQLSQIVLGVEGDLTWANMTGTGTDVSTVNGDIASHTDAIRWISTLAGRLGYANNNWLIFAKGGWAWARFDGSTITNTAAGTFSSSSTASETRNGWMLGGGLEWGFAQHWSAKIEYDYVKFAAATYTINEVTAAGVVSTPTRSAVSSLNMVKAGVAYHF